ncbi:C-C motif chemokine 5-like [Parambassis ranga]|uniref:C-C motif chemokine 5-like n=1 Tax=Parambassis ranga TaxID=210632 RepID=A0A6P7K9P7_9TELE|nr:C-C motif chemokine 5-like [Parambassis ranga]
MRSAQILLLCILGAALLSTVFCNSAIGPDECCFIYYKRKIAPKLVSSYSMTDSACPKTAAIFVTKRSRQVCVDPSQGWVKNVMRILDDSSF